MAEDRRRVEVLGTPRNQKTKAVEASMSATSYLDVEGTPNVFRGKRNPKKIYDRIYQTIQIPALLIAVMDTEEFQRLDRVAQLGGSSYVYPSAKHSRKEHSIGVAYLAGDLIRWLQRQQPDLGIDDDDVACIELAALCHDLGHGPNSHMFDLFLDEALAKKKKRTFYSHEERSVALLRRICEDEKKNLQQYFSDETRFQQHINFACRLIRGLGDDKAWPQKEIGRPERKRFMFDIVANARSGIDVDKIDYLLRDQLATTGKSNTIDFKRLIFGSSVKVVNNKTQIVFEHKLLHNLYDIFTERARLHRDVYQHRVSVVAELMVVDVLLAAEQSEFRIRGKRISEASEDLDTFIFLTDSIFDAIRMSDAAGLDKAHEILRRLASRDFYRAVYMTANLETLPKCTHCGKPTEPKWKVCPYCGKDTSDRDYIFVKPGLIKPKNSLLGVSTDPNEYIQKIIAEYQAPHEIDADEIHVRIGKISLGEKIEIFDPHNGKKWQSYHPLGNVNFYNPKADDIEDQAKKIDPLSYEGIFTAKGTHELTLTCYYKGLDDSKIQPLYDAVKAVFLKNNIQDRQGRANYPSPAPSRNNSLVSVPPRQHYTPHEDTDNDDDDDPPLAKRARTNGHAAGFRLPESPVLTVL